MTVIFSANIINFLFFYLHYHQKTWPNQWGLECAVCITCRKVTPSKKGVLDMTLYIYICARACVCVSRILSFTVQIKISFNRSLMNVKLNPILWGHIKKSDNFFVPFFIEQLDPKIMSWTSHNLDIDPISMVFSSNNHLGDELW